MSLQPAWIPRPTQGANPDLASAKLDLTYLGPMKGENTFDLLVLPAGHRNMVESLVTQHYLDRASAADGTDEVDIVRGKGIVPCILLLVQTAKTRSHTQAKV